jgi:UDP-N-acetyl-D-mannosaminuronic acid dehydrogenase
MPFMESGAEPLLRKGLEDGSLVLTSDAAQAAEAAVLIIVIGTPVDEFLNPSLKAITRCIDELLPWICDDQLLVLRSTVYPGVTEAIAKHLASKSKHPKISFCPERIVQGKAVEELTTLPQIVSGTTREAEQAAATLFGRIAPEIVRLSPIEAELAKLFGNAWRYIEFAVANGFFMIATDAGANYYRVQNALTLGYPRAHNLASAGFAAGPCLFKDTMQLAAFYRNQFGLGFEAMLVNEGMPQFIVDRVAARHRLEDMTVGLLGMAFKAESDDPRSSLSYKLKKLLAFRAKAVLTTDPYVTTDPSLLPLEEVVSRSDILVLCVPHNIYRDLDVANKVVMDVWNIWGKATTAETQASVRHA